MLIPYKKAAQRINRAREKLFNSETVPSVHIALINPQTDRQRVGGFSF